MNVGRMIQQARTQARKREMRELLAGARDRDRDLILAYWWWGWAISGHGGLGRPGADV